jgi:hypothetical protein
MKIKEPIVPFVSTKVVKLVVEVIAQLVKARVPLKYPCIIYFYSEHHAPNCPRKKKIQNTFQIKPTTTTTTTTIIIKTSKPNNIPVNVVVVVTEYQNKC